MMMCNEVSTISPTISIIVPVYKTEQFLHRCIDNILAQTFTDFELILVDDGSPDKCGLICDEYAQKDKRIRVIHKDNGGVSSARNCGIDTAVGKYLMFCDSDDWVDNNWCMCLVDAISQHPNAWIVCGVQKYYDIDSTISLYPPSCGGMFESILDTDEYFQIYKSYLSAYSFNKIYSRSIVQGEQIQFDKSIRNGEDIDFNIRYLSFCERIVCLSVAPYHYNCANVQSEMGRYKPNRFDDSKYAYGVRLPVIAPNYLREYRAMWFSRFMADFQHVFDSQNTWRFAQKIQYCNRALKSTEFQDCLNSTDCTEMNGLYFSFLNNGNYWLVWLYDLLRKCLHKQQIRIKRH